MTPEQRKQIIGATIIDIEETDSGVVTVYAINGDTSTTFALNVKTKTTIEAVDLKEA